VLESDSSDDSTQTSLASPEEDEGRGGIHRGDVKTEKERMIDAFKRDAEGRAGGPDVTLSEFMSRLDSLLEPDPAVASGGSASRHSESVCEGGVEAHAQTALANLPRHTPTDHGALAPRSKGAAAANEQQQAAECPVSLPLARQAVPLSDAQRQSERQTERRADDGRRTASGRWLPPSCADMNVPIPSLPQTLIGPGTQNVCMRACMHVRIYDAYMCVCLYACMHVCANMHACMHACMFRMYACMHVVHACMHARMQITAYIGTTSGRTRPALQHSDLAHVPQS